MRKNRGAPARRAGVTTTSQKPAAEEGGCPGLEAKRATQPSRGYGGCAPRSCTRVAQPLHGPFCVDGVGTSVPLGGSSV